MIAMEIEPTRKTKKGRLIKYKKKTLLQRHDDFVKRGITARTEIHSDGTIVQFIMSGDDRGIRVIK